VTILVFAIVLSVALFKLANEPYIFDPTFGAHSVYGFTISDVQEPLTVFYVKEGAEFIAADGDFHVANRTLQIRSGRNASAEWDFDTEAFLTILERYGGDLRETAIFLTSSSPVSAVNNTSVGIYVNDHLLVNGSLSTVAEGKYTWNVTTQWNIPGSNFGYPFVFAVFPISSEPVLAEPSTQQTRVRVETSEGVDWDVEYVVLKMSSDPDSLRYPWWRQNFSLLFVVYASFFLIAAAVLALKFEQKIRASTLSAIDTIRKWISGNRFILFVVATGLLLRIILVLAFPLGSGDQFTYRFIGLSSYYYGIDTRSFYGMYGTVWHGLLLVTYPLYFFIVQFASSVSAQYVILKLPIVASDILIAFCLYRIGGKLFSPRIAKILLVFWLFNPYVFWLSSIWGTHHIVSTMLTVLAVERITYGHYREGGIALSAAIFSGPNNIFVLPIFLILTYKASGRPKLEEFGTSFLLGCSAFALPWTFSISVFFNTYAGAGRIGFSTLSYSPLLVPPAIAGLWSILSELIGLGLLYVYLARKKQSSISRISNSILVAFLIFYLTNTLVFPTYALWSLPFLLFVYVSNRKIPFSYLIAFISFPILWIMYWTPPLLPQFLQAPGTEIFRETFGVNFSLVCILILMKLSFAGDRPLLKNSLKFHVERTKGLIITSFVVATLVLIVFAQWIKEPLWLTLWNDLLKPSLLIISIIAVLSIPWMQRESFRTKMTLSSLRITKERYAAVAAVSVVWLYNLLSLISSQISPLARLSPILLSSPDDLYFSIILLLWLPLLTREILRNRQSIFLVPWILLIQIDYIITRHYSTYIVVDRILFMYVATHTPTLIADLLAVTLMLSCLLLMAFYEPRESLDATNSKGLDIRAT